MSYSQLTLRVRCSCRFRDHKHDRSRKSPKLANAPGGGITAVRAPYAGSRCARLRGLKTPDVPYRLWSRAPLADSHRFCCCDPAALLPPGLSLSPCSTH